VAAVRRWVVLALDADASGDAGAARLSPALQSLGAQVERWRPTAGKDWNHLLVRDAPRLRTALFTAAAGHQYQETRDHLAAICRGVLPSHAALATAIDVCDYPAFSRERAAWAHAVMQTSEMTR
jgi:DNA primase